VTIEDVDIFDLNERASGTDNQDIKCLYSNLTSGSENHMLAFMRLFQRNGGSCAAQYISQDELETILQTDSSRGRARGRRGIR